MDVEKVEGGRQERRKVEKLCYFPRVAKTGQLAIIDLLPNNCRAGSLGLSINTASLSLSLFF